MLNSLILLITAYLTGSINFPILLFKLLGKDDPRNSFSGNPGTTNVYRQAGLAWAVVVLSLDLGRAVAIAFAAVHFVDARFITWIGFTLILGNRFPCFHGFKGGKGVANFLGFSAVLSFYTAILSGIAWLVVNFLSKKPFLASFALVGILAAGTILLFQDSTVAIIGTVTTAIFIFWNHKKNLIEFKQEQAEKKST